MDNHVFQDLEGPYDHHVYIGYASVDKDTVLDLRCSLKRSGLICCDRSTDSYILKSIRSGVTSSRKCLVFLTSNYQKDKEAWYQIETEAMLEKTERFSRDTLVILKTESVKEVPEKLRDFKEISFKPEKLKDEKYMAQLVDIFLQEPVVSLTILPKLNMGYWSALGYFFGFLRLILPGFKKRLIEETLQNDSHLLPFTVKKMLIIVPKSCFCPIRFDSPNKIEFTGKFVVRVANRAGSVRRDYKSSFYKLTDDDQKKEYYFAGGLATPLMTMYDTYVSGLSRMTLDQLYAERDTFCLALKAILSHPDNAECYDQFRLLYWRDPETKDQNHQELHNFLLPVLEKELDLERQNEETVSKDGKLYDVISQIAESNSMPNKTYEMLEVPGSNPSRIYVQLPVYPMNKKPRGKCLIVNIINFSNDVYTRRDGAENDTHILRNLFSYLHFEVMVHINVTENELEGLFLEVSRFDHSNYDAFVCCIMTHGRLGKIYTSDGKLVEILRLVDFFTDKNCPSLKGKPKMFFIQACQKGVAESENEDANSPVHHGTARVTADFEDDTKRLSVSSCPSEAHDVRETHFQTNSVQVDAKGDPNISGFDEPLKHKAVLVPSSPDFLMSYSTLPGSISYRHPKTGSLYIKALNDCMRKSLEMDLILKQVISQVRKNLEEHGEQDGGTDRFQLPFHLTSGMERLIYLS